MFGWLFPRPPLAAVEKAWTEIHLQGLTQQLGLSRLLAASVPLPDQIVLLSTSDNGLADAQRVLARLCETAGIHEHRFEVRTVASQCGASAAPTDVDLVRIPESLLPNTYAVAASLARELSLRQLPPAWAARHDERQVLWLADLVAVYMGWGAVLAHPMADALPAASGGACSCAGHHPAHYLPSRMIGYALALFALARNEVVPDWRQQLRPDAQVVFDRARTYLRRTKDTLFTRDSAAQPSATQTTAELVHQLATGSLSARVAALWALRAPHHAEIALPLVTRCLHDRAPVLREEAARTLASYGTAAAPALPSLLDLLHDGNYSVRAAAAGAVGQVGEYSAHALEQLTLLLSDEEPLVVRHAAAALEKSGIAGQTAIPSVLAALRGAVIRCDQSLIDTLTHTLYALEPDPTTRVMEFFDEDPELREQVVHVIVEAIGNEGHGELA